MRLGWWRVADRVHRRGRPRKALVATLPGLGRPPSRRRCDRPPRLFGKATDESRGASTVVGAGLWTQVKMVGFCDSLESLDMPAPPE